VSTTSGWLTVPLFGAYVSAGGNGDYTDLFGFYTIDNLPLGHTYTVTATKSGYITQEFSVTLTTSSPTGNVNFILERTTHGNGGKFAMVDQATSEIGEGNNGNLY
jgi:hypothetical protein